MTESRTSLRRPDSRRLTGVAALVAALISGGAFAAPAEESLPVAPATVSAGQAQDPDTAALVATLQKQIAAQQAQLATLEQHLQAKPASAPASGPADREESVVVNGQEVGHPASAPASPLPASGAVTPVPAPETTGAPATASLAATGSVTPEAGRPSAESAPATDGAGLALTTEAQRQAYASGVGVWRDIENSLTTQRAMGIELDRQYVMAGLADMYARRPLKMSREAMDTVMSTLNAQYTDQARAVKEHQEAEGKAYRIAFSRKKGAVSDAGAWYQITERGTGRHLRTSDMAELQVTGMLPDGTVFDPSGQRGQSKTVKVGALLPAVAIGLQKVGVGGHLTVVVPPGKGYGDAGLPPAIPGGATLIFDIQVKGISTAK